MRKNGGMHGKKGQGLVFMGLLHLAKIQKKDMLRMIYRREIRIFGEMILTSREGKGEDRRALFLPVLLVARHLAVVHNRHLLTRSLDPLVEGLIKGQKAIDRAGLDVVGQPEEKINQCTTRMPMIQL